MLLTFRFDRNRKYTRLGIFEMVCFICVHLKDMMQTAFCLLCLWAAPHLRVLLSMLLESGWGFQLTDLQNCWEGLAKNEKYFQELCQCCWRRCTAKAFGLRIHSLITYNCSTSETEHLDRKDLGTCIGQCPEKHAPLKCHLCLTMGSTHSYDLPM